MTGRTVHLNIKTSDGGENKVSFKVSDGKSSYENWKKIEGNADKTIEEYVESLRGVKGADVTDIETTIEEDEVVPPAKVYSIKSTTPANNESIQMSGSPTAVSVVISAEDDTFGPEDTVVTAVFHGNDGGDETLNGALDKAGSVTFNHQFSKAGQHTITITSPILTEAGVITLTLLPNSEVPDPVDPD